MPERGIVSGEHRLFYAVYDGEWKPVGEIADFSCVEEIEVSPVSLNSFSGEWSFEIEPTSGLEYLFWIAEWQIQKAVPKISRN